MLVDHDEELIILVFEGSDWPISLQAKSFPLYEVAPFDFDGIDHVLIRHGVKIVHFIGAPWRTIAVTVAKNAIQKTKFLGRIIWRSNQWPHTLLIAIREHFAERGIRCTSYIDLIPTLALPPGACFGDPDEVDTNTVLSMAKAATADQGRLYVKQTIAITKGPENTYNAYLQESFGTDRLIRHIQRKKRQNAENIYLVKSGVGEIDDVDTPVIGIQTVKNAFNAGVSGLIIEANVVAVFQQKEIRRFCNEHDIFVISSDFQ